MDEKLRQEALLKLVDNNVSASNMEVWIAGYIAGRNSNTQELLELINKVCQLENELTES